MSAPYPALQNSSDVVALVNRSGDVLAAGPQSINVLGWPPGALVGRNTFDLIHPEDREHSRRALEALLESASAPRQIEVRVYGLDGQWRWVEKTFSNFLHEPRIAAIVLTCRELDVRNAEREQQQKQNEELVRTNVKLEDLAYAVAHDLKEPLRTISMFTELLLQAGSENERKELAGFIVDGAKRMSALIEGLHAFALHSFDDPPTRVDLNLAASDALTVLTQAISDCNATVTLGPLPQVLGHKKQLVRVLQNIISNAVKYRSTAPLHIQIGADKVASEWRIRVSDNGVGIPPEHRRRIFQLLKRLHGAENPGAGLGLAICKKLIEGMGGEIWVESNPGGGSAFYFTIPAITDEPSPSAGIGESNSKGITGQSPSARTLLVAGSQVMASFALEVALGAAGAVQA